MYSAFLPNYTVGEYKLNSLLFCFIFVFTGGYEYKICTKYSSNLFFKKSFQAME